MKKGIKIVVLLIFGLNLTVQGQFYVSPNTCFDNNANASSSGPTAGNSSSTSCGSPTSFFDLDSNSVSWSWNFAEANAQIPINARNISYNFKTGGTKNVVLKKTYADGSIVSVNKTIEVKAYPQQPTFWKKISADTTVCDGSRLTLNPFSNGGIGSNYTYLWFPNGETSSTITVDSSGCYSVEVSDGSSKCTRIAKIKVTFCMQESKDAGGNEKWYFGDKAALNFQSISTLIPPDFMADTGQVISQPQYKIDGYGPSAQKSNNPLVTDGATAMVFGPKGNLQYYSDGEKLYSGLGDVLVNNQDNSDFSENAKPSSQGVLLLPKIVCNECQHHQYYLFTVNPNSHLLSYSVVDTRFNKKVGAVVEKDVPVALNVDDRLVAMPNKDATGFVVFGHNIKTDDFVILETDTAGVHLKSQNIANTITTRAGYEAISPDQKMMAQVNSFLGKNYVQIFDIDPTNYQLKLNKQIDLGNSPGFAYGVTFSPDNKLIYVTIQGQLNTANSSQLMQINISKGTINKIASSTTELFGAVEYGPIDGSGSKYVYLTISGRTKMPYLQSPNVEGDAKAVGYSDLPGSAISGTDVGGTVKLGLPNIVHAFKKQEGEGISASYNGHCFKAPSILTANKICSPMDNVVSWAFENGDTKEGSVVSYTFPKIGWNNFKLKIKTINKPKITGNATVDKAFETTCVEKVYDAKIYIQPSPEFTLPKDFGICTSDGEKRAVDVHATGGYGFTYNWMTSLNTHLTPSDSSYEFFAPALYKIEVKNAYNCVTKADFKVVESCEGRVYLPEAFSPNGDGKNETFEIYSKYTINDVLIIYNRWGEKVYETLADPNEPSRAGFENWDGKYKGKTYSNAIYPYVYLYQNQIGADKSTHKITGVVYTIE